LSSARRLTIVFWIAGIAVIATLVHLVDVSEVVRSVSVIGWGFIPVLSIRVVVLLVDSKSWLCLLQAEDRPRPQLAAYQRWIGESVSAMLPFAAIGGELARIRVIILSGMSSPLAFGSIIMDGVVALASQFLFLCLGILLFVQTATGADSLNQSILLGSVALMIAIITIWTLVRGGALGWLGEVMTNNLANERVIWIANAMESVDQRISEIADDPISLTRSVAWRVLGWLLGASEIWLILYLLGHAISVSDALILDAVTAAVRTTFFFVPGGLAVQEGAMILVGSTLGASGDAILIAAVIKRAREIFVSIPGLLAWELIESKSMARSAASDSRI
jgi:putative membrane protein